MTTTSEVCQTKNPPAKHLLQIETLRAPPEMKYIITRQCDISNQTNHDLHWNSHCNSSELSVDRLITMSYNPADRWVAEKLFDSRSGSSSTRDSKWCYPANYDSKKSMCIMKWLIPTWDLFRKFDSHSGTPTEAYSAYLIQPPEHQLRLVPQIWFSSRRTPNSGLFRKLDSTGDTTFGPEPQLRLIPQIFTCSGLCSVGFPR